MKKNSSVFAIIMILLSGCVTKTNHLSVIVPKEKTFSVEELHKAKVVENVEEGQTTFVLTFIPFGYPNFGNIVDNILTKYQGKALVNATITESNRWYILFGFNEINIKADVVK